MKNNGQAALEYLMAYGWALIVIAIVVGVLIWGTTQQTGGITEEINFEYPILSCEVDENCTSISSLECEGQDLEIACFETECVCKTIQEN